jgi:CHAD domain-containing protein
MGMALDAKRMQKTIRKLRKLVRKTPKRPTPENIHDLRTYTRRFEAAVAALNLDSRRNERRLLRDLSRARKRAGKIRDMDALTSYTANVNANQQQDCLVQLLEYLGARRYGQAERLQAEMRKRRCALRRRLKRASVRIDKLMVATNKDSAAAQNGASADAMASAVKLSEELTVPATLTKNNLHPYRLKVKELRYVLQMADSPDTRAFIDSLGEVKDAIGEWHDWEELIVIAADLDEHGPNCKLVEELKKISQRKYEHALSLTNQMRKDYLRGSASARKRGSLRKLKPAPPLLHAVSAIAS